jgi:hypothetical protein
MTPGRLGEILGLPPIPQGTWAEEALYVSPAALRRGEEPGEMAARLRALPGIAEVRVRADGFLEIAVAVPGDLVVELTGTVSPDPPISAASRAFTASPAPSPLPDTAVSPWTDTPRTWGNTGFVVKYAHVRAVAVRRWAAELGVCGRFRPELLDGRWDRAVLRLLAEVHGRRASRDPGWAAYTERLALAYHDAVERAAVLPMGDEEPSPLHSARAELARAVQAVLAEGLAALGETAPDRL